MKLFISSGEPSSDLHASQFLSALRELDSSIDLYGIGGENLKRVPGFRLKADQRELTAMGFAEVIGKLPKIARLLNEVEMWAEEESPDAALVFDYPDFHFKVAERLARRGIPVFCFIPPKVWAWRSGRIHRLKKLYKHVFTIFPFESGIFEKNDVPFTYMGNPLLDELPFATTKTEAREKLGLGERSRVLLMMPGSRSAELKYLLEPMMVAVKRLYDSGKLDHILIPLPKNGRRAAVEQWFDAHAEYRMLPVRISEGDSHLAMIAADAGLIKSGTSTLEAALLKLPHVVTYHGHWLSKIVFHLVVRYTGAISLVNLVEDLKIKKANYIVPELILEDFGSDQFVQHLSPLLESGSSERTRMLQGFDRVYAKLSAFGGSPSRFAAEKFLKLMREKTSS